MKYNKVRNKAGVLLDQKLLQKEVILELTGINN